MNSRLTSLTDRRIEGRIDDRYHTICGDVLPVTTAPLRAVASADQSQRIPVNSIRFECRICNGAASVQVADLTAQSN